MTKANPTVDDYLAALPAETRAVLTKLRKTIRAVAPQAAEVIGYQIPMYKHHGHLVAFSAAKDYCTFTVMSPDVLRAHAAELKNYKLGKASIRFSPDKPLPAALVRQMVKERVAENESGGIAAYRKPAGKKGKAVPKAKPKVTNKTDKVNAFMAELDHPFKAEVQAVRKIIMNVNKGITEEIKWAAPSFSYKGYMVTFNLWAKDRVHLVFHNGAILRDKSGLLEGDYPDRRMMYFRDMKEVKAKKAALENFVKNWIKEMDKRS